MDGELVLDALTENMEQLLEKFPEMKQDALARAGETMLEAVRSGVAGSGMRHGGGPIAQWQQYAVGTGKGYVAVRPVKTKGTGKSPGAITSYTEHGHKIRGPGKTRRRVNVASVQGYHYYSAADGPAQQAGLQAAEALCRSVAEGLMEGIGR